MGPLTAGESAEQTFTAPGSYLAGINIDLRLPKDSRPSPLIELRLTRLQDGQVIREGRIQVDPILGRQTLFWQFEPIRRSAGQGYAIAVVIGEATSGEIFVPVSTDDSFVGTLTTNGLATGAHIDLLLTFSRRADSVDVIRALLLAGPTIAAPLLFMPILTLAFMLLARAPVQALARAARLSNSIPKPYVLSLGLWSVGAAVVIPTFASTHQPENTLQFWITLTITALIPGFLFAVLFFLYILGLTISKWGYRPVFRSFALVLIMIALMTVRRIGLVAGKPTRIFVARSARWLYHHGMRVSCKLWCGGKAIIQFVKSSAPFQIVVRLARRTATISDQECGRRPFTPSKNCLHDATRTRGYSDQKQPPS